MKNNLSFRGICGFYLWRTTPQNPLELYDKESNDVLVTDEGELLGGAATSSRAEKNSFTKG